MKHPLYAGIGRIVITPPTGTDLAGYGYRDHGAEETLDDLEVRILWLETDAGSQDALCFVSADIIGFGDRLTADLRSIVRQRTGIAPERVLLAASHTHSGPQTVENMVGCGRLDEAVYRYILDLTAAAMEMASRHVAPVSLHTVRGKLEGYAINRRVVRNGQVLFMPNPEGVRDDEVIAVVCRDAATGQPRAVLFNFACHPTIMGDYRISGDYPGAARRRIETALGENAVALFLPGCFGDIRPNCVYTGGTRFRRGEAEDVAVFGNALGDEVVRLTRLDGTALVPRFFAAAETLSLRIQHHPERAELEHILREGPDHRKAWASFLLERPFSQTRTLSLQRVDLSDDTRLIVMGGEICCDYGHFVKRLDPSICMIPVGYANGMTGYIPTARMIKEGGYEPDTSCPFFGLPAPFEPEVEEILHKAIRTICRDHM